MTDFTKTRSMFHLPEGVIYLDGNSLGPLPLAARERVARLLSDEWGEMLIRGWNDAGWMDQPTGIGDRIAPLIGAAAGTVVMGIPCPSRSTRRWRRPWRCGLGDASSSPTTATSRPTSTWRRG